MADAYVIDAIRTPFGRYGGALAKTRPDDLAATLYYLLGINPENEVIDRNNRPLVIGGKPVLEVVA